MREPSTSNNSITAESLVARLKEALKTTGDFPVSARIVGEVSALTKNPNVTAEKLSSVILKDPTLGIRLLSVVNSSYYQRSRPILTVSQAIVHIGLNQLSDLCANLVLLQSFVPHARQGGIFANSLRKAILASVLTELISLQITGREGISNGGARTETGYLLGFFAELGAMLLAFYYPQIYTTALKRAESRSIDINRSIQQLVGITPITISGEIIRALDLPPFYAQVMSVVNELRHDPAVIGSLRGDIKAATISIFIADTLSGLLVPERRKRDLDKTVIECCAAVDIPSNLLPPVLRNLQSSFEEYCNMLELTFSPLPNYLETYTDESIAQLDSLGANDEEALADTIKEIKVLIESGESLNSVITSVMEALAWGLCFDRVVLLMMTNSSHSSLQGHMSLGDVENLNVREINRDFPNRGGVQDAVATAAAELRPIFNGEPLLPDGWPLVAIPIGADKPIGVIYADKVNSIEDELSVQQQSAIIMLYNLMTQAVTIQDRETK